MTHEPDCLGGVLLALLIGTLAFAWLLVAHAETAEERARRLDGVGRSTGIVWTRPLTP